MEILSNARYDHDMSVWALADLHLAISVPAKNMAVLSSAWEGYMEKIEREWKNCVGKEDLVLLPGDISWALRLEEVVTDLVWLDHLPGTKLMIRGNHDYWWSSSKKMAEKFPSSIYFIQNNAFHWNDIAIGGTRLWDTPEYHFDDYVHFQENPQSQQVREIVDDTAIFEREIQRLKLSLAEMNPHAKVKIVMTHYPPISADLCSSRVSQILEEFGIDVCVFGHLHNISQNVPLFGERGGIKYFLTAADYLHFKPLKVL